LKCWRLLHWWALRSARLWHTKLQRPQLWMARRSRVTVGSILSSKLWSTISIQIQAKDLSQNELLLLRNAKLARDGLGLSGPYKTNQKNIRGKNKNDVWWDFYVNNSPPILPAPSAVHAPMQHSWQSVNRYYVMSDPGLILFFVVSATALIH
jgi:hypothetical protein